MADFGAYYQQALDAEMKKLGITDYNAVPPASKLAAQQIAQKAIVQENDALMASMRNKPKGGGGYRPKNGPRIRSVVGGALGWIPAALQGMQWNPQQEINQMTNPSGVVDQYGRPLS
jgi:hypothetical protein